MKARVVWLLVVVVAVSGCTSVRSVLGIQGPGNPTIELKSAEPRWLLINNPRFGDVRSEPEYIWVEEDKVPLTITTLIRGKGAIICTASVAGIRSGAGGPAYSASKAGVISLVKTACNELYGTGIRINAQKPVATRTAAVVSAPAPESLRRGFVVYVDTARVVIDLTAVDGVRPGTVLSLRRDRIPIIHPVTGEVLGELDEEVATARVTETRERFSVAEIQAITPGAQVQVKDRVVLK